MSLTVRLGVNPLSWMNDDLPSLGGDTPLETALSEGKAIGYEGFELGNKFPADGPGLKAKLAEFGLVCVTGWYCGYLAIDTLQAEIERCDAHMRKLQHNGCKVFIYGECADTIQGQQETALSARPQFSSAQQWVEYGQRLNAFADHVKTHYGLDLAYHFHTGAYVESGADIDRLMEVTGPQVGLTFDTGHAYFGGTAQPHVLLKKHIARVRHVHCKDIRGEVMLRARSEGWSFLDSVLAGAFTVPGDGVIDFEAVIGVLSEANYAGWLVVEAEQDPVKAPSRQYAQMGYDTLRRLVDQANSTNATNATPA
jgi:inosose dehydratase